MAQLKLRPWEFSKNEIVELYWFGQPFKNQERQWMIKTLFKQQNGILREEFFPWGTLPYLRIGQKYINGMPSEIPATGIRLNISLSSSMKFEICKGFDIPRSLYEFAKKPSYGEQLLCKFEINKMIYYLPCIEIVRSFFALYSSFANRLLEANGLDSLAGTYTVKKDHIHINFTREVPMQLLKDDIVSYYVWLRFNEKAKVAWDSVYHLLLKKAYNKIPHDISKSFLEGILVEVKPPVSEKEMWVFRGLKYLNNILILEIMERTGLFLPFHSISYSSPKLLKPGKDNQLKTRIPKNTNSQIKNLILDEADLPADKWKTPYTVNNRITGFIFDETPLVSKVREISGHLHTGDNNTNKANEEGEFNKKVHDKKSATTQDWLIGGKIRSLEFLSLQNIPADLPPELENFLNMTEQIKLKEKRWNISTQVFRISSSKGVIIPGPACIIIKISGVDAGNSYLVEIERSGNLPVSTLLLKPTTNQSNDEQMIKTNLAVLKKNHFHWNVNYLKKQKKHKFQLMRHIPAQPVMEWSERVINRIKRT